ncbi:helix-turn-helix domain-containing protein [Candidatus Acetothermia bacterium]|nr:helix-turn-helix domain-containing protein [Candidatus Acetothermia bacterium]
MNRRKNRYEEFKKKALKNPRVRASFEEGLDELRVAVAAAELRQKMQLSQTKLAKKVGTTQAVISRFENGGNVELRTLFRVARALGTILRFEFVPHKERHKASSSKRA